MTKRNFSLFEWLSGQRLFIALIFCLIMLLSFQLNTAAENTDLITEDSTLVVLQGDRILSTSPDVVMRHNEIAIYGNGPFRLQGELNNTQLHIKAKGETVLILDNATITNSDDAALVSDKKCDLKLVLEDNSTNVISSGETKNLIPDKEATGAALNVKGDLTITGTGKLTINGYLNNGIRCRHTLRLSDRVQLEVKASNRAIRAVECYFEDGIYQFISGDSCIYTEKRLNISGGSITAETSDHCVASDGMIKIEGGNISLKSPEKRGINSVDMVQISGGELTIDALGDGIFSEAGIEIAGGSVTVISGGDGIQVGGKREYDRAPVHLSGGTILISAYEDPIDAVNGYYIKGASLLGSGISGRTKGTTADQSQQVFFESMKGKKHDHIKVLKQNDILLQMTAAYGYNVVVYSIPGVTSGQTQLKVG